jgi:predicted ArsR family transcriptional regulator
MSDPVAHPEPGAPVAASLVRDREPETGGREGVARSLLTDGPATAAVLADRLGVSATVVRRHLDHLLAQGLVEALERPPYGPTPRRGRGRPARVFALTSAGRAGFSASYDDLAVAALEHLQRHGGPDAVLEFARARAADLETSVRARLATAGHGEDPDAELAEALTGLGFAAAVEPALGGHQLCQHHCPVSHVAERFPQLCEAETEALARILGRHVQRLATIAHGDGVCTTVIPSARPERSTA